MGDDSLVVALYGKWGQGKSSVKNMVIERIDELGTLDWVEFNPWQFSGQAALYEAFFYEVGVSLGNTDKSPQGKKLVKKWRYYATALKLGTSLLGPLRWIVSLSLFGVAIVAFGASVLLGEYMRIIAWVLGGFTGLLAALLQWSSDFASQVADWLDLRAKIHEKSITEVKDELKGILEARPKPLLVIIDDIDRLTRSEIRLLFQLIKANVDLPKMVYLLCAQRDIVESSLEETAALSGRDFLEKIVQVQFDVPAIERARLEEILFDGLKKALGLQGEFSESDESRWSNV